MRKIDRTGEIGKNKETLGGYEMKIVEYYNKDNIVIEFQDEYKHRKRTTYRNFKNGEVANPYGRSVYNVGYVGVGKYSHLSHHKIWNNWHDMLYRCYVKECNLSYNDCCVCEEWHNFQNFAKWWEENYYEIDGEKMGLDKDILIKGNKIYSPNTCVFVPQKINNLFVKKQNNRGTYPIGVTKTTDGLSLRARCNLYKKEKHLGNFPLNRPFQAFYTYKTFKEQYIKQVADEYKHLIPQKLYEAMYNYQVEIND